MYVQTGLGEVFKPRSRYKPPQRYFITVSWGIEVPFRKNFGAFRQELSKAIRALVTAETDKKLIDGLLLLNKNEEVKLKEQHDSMLKRRSPQLKELDPVRVDVDIRFNKTDYTDVYDILVLGH